MDDDVEMSTDTSDSGSSDISDDGSSDFDDSYDDADIDTDDIDEDVSDEEIDDTDELDEIDEDVSDEEFDDTDADSDELEEIDEDISDEELDDTDANTDKLGEVDEDVSDNEFSDTDADTEELEMSEDTADTSANDEADTAEDTADTDTEEPEMTEDTADTSADDEANTTEDTADTNSEEPEMTENTTDTSADDEADTTEDTADTDTEEPEMTEVTDDTAADDESDTAEDTTDTDTEEPEMTEETDYMAADDEADTVEDTVDTNTENPKMAEKTNEANDANETQPKHGFKDWVNPQNYDEDGHYIGEKQDFGYKPHIDGQEVDTSTYRDYVEQQAASSISEYMSKHGYGRDDFATYSQDPEWRNLMRKEYPDYELPELTQESAKSQLSDYMNERNYGQDDFATYSQDPQWRELQKAAYPDYELLHLDSTETELTDNDLQSELEDDFNEYNDYKANIFENHKLDRNYDIQSIEDSKDLTPVERDTIERYSGIDYRNINKSLYDPEFKPQSLEQDNQLKSDINTLTDCLDRKELPYDARTYRGVSDMSIIFGDDFNKLSIQELNAKYSGQYFVNEGFTSASTKEKVAKRFSGSSNGGVMQIDLPKGSNAMCLGDVSLYKNGEKEVLMQKGTMFRIDSVGSRSGKLFIKTTAVGN